MLHHWYKLILGLAMSMLELCKIDVVLDIFHMRIFLQLALQAGKEVFGHVRPYTSINILTYTVLNSVMMFKAIFMESIVGFILICIDMCGFMNVLGNNWKQSVGCGIVNVLCDYITIPFNHTKDNVLFIITTTMAEAFSKVGLVTLHVACKLWEVVIQILKNPD